MVYAVTSADVAARWRPLSDAEAAVADVLLEDAAVLLDHQRPLTPDQVASGTIPERLVTIVLADAVQAVLRNPDVQASIQLGADGSLGQGWHREVAAEARLRLHLSAAALSALTPAPDVPSGGTGYYSVPYS